MEPTDWEPSGVEAVTHHEIDDKATWRGDPSVHDEVMSRFQRHVMEHRMLMLRNNLFEALPAVSIWIGGSWRWKPHHEDLRDHSGAHYYWSVEWGAFQLALVWP